MENAQPEQNAPMATPPMARKRRRTIPVIDARFQWKYTIIITALGVGLTAIMGGFLYRAHVDNTHLLDLDGNPALQQEVMRGDQIFLIYLIVFVAIMAVALAVWGLVVTHRISGPLFILSRYMNEIAEGRYPDLRPLRKRDELREFFAAFEDAVVTLKNRDAVALRAVDDALAQARKATGSDAAAGLALCVRALERQREVLIASLGTDEPQP